MYSLSKTKSTYKISNKKRKIKGWIIYSKNYMGLEKIARNLTNDVPKVYLKRIDLSNTTSSSIESDSRDEVLDESMEKSRQQDVQPSLSKITLCDTSVESLNDKIVDTVVNSNDIKHIIFGKSLEASIKEIVNERDVVPNLSGSTNVSDSDEWLNNKAKGNYRDSTKNVILDESLETSIEENNVDQQNNNINFKTSTLSEELLETSSKQVDQTVNQQDLDVAFPANEILEASFSNILMEDTQYEEAEETVTQNKRHDKVELPSMEDIQKLYNYLKMRGNILYNNLIKSYNYNTWLELLKVTLTSMQVYNRRRAGEIEKVLIEDYKCYKSVGEHTDPEVNNSLSETGKGVIKKYVTFDVRGKLGRTVPVLLHSQLQDCIELLLQHRSNAKVESRNPFLFGIPGYDKHRYKHLRACLLMRDYSSKCGAARPFTLRGTILRRHIATGCITLNLSEWEVTELANFMGHDKSIHKSHYRQSIPELNIPIHSLDF